MAKAVIRGDRQLVANIRSLSKAFPDGVADEICRQALEPMAEQIRGNASAKQAGSDDKGERVADGIVIAKRPESRRGRRVFWVSLKGLAKQVGHLSEFGTAPHWQPFFRGGWMHPGSRARPWFRPGYEATKNEVVRRFGQLVEARLKAIAATLRIER